ncbi:zinc ribbon domain-containing protein [Thermodesulfobacteriota bacterium]
MSERMKEQLDILVNLQQVEIEIGSIKSKLNTVPIQLEKLDCRLSEFEDNLQNNESILNELQKQYRQHESDVQVNLSKIQRSQEKLRSVKNNKEYQSILKEIEDIQTKNSIIEDEMIECLDQMEEVEKAIQTEKAELVKIKYQNDIEKNTIKQEAEKGHQRLAELENEINRISSKIETKLLTKYKLVKDQVKGVGIAAVIKEVCQGCNLNIPPQMYNELQRYDRLTLCPHCQRIIYWEESQ